MTRKIVSEMTYNVSMGTLNPTIPYPPVCSVAECALQTCIIVLLQIVVKLDAYNLMTLLQIEPETDFWL